MIVITMLSVTCTYFHPCGEDDPVWGSNKDELFLPDEVDPKNDGGCDPVAHGHRDIHVPSCDATLDHVDPINCFLGAIGRGEVETVVQDV
jgi:hypothetical protein